MEEVVGNLAPVTPPLGTKREYALPWDDEDDEKRRMSPKRRVRSIQEDFPGGDELIGEAILQDELNKISDDEVEEKGVGKPPEVSEEQCEFLSPGNNGRRNPVRTWTERQHHAE